MPHGPVKMQMSHLPYLYRAKAEGAEFPLATCIGCCCFTHRYQIYGAICSDVSELLDGDLSLSMAHLRVVSVNS